MVPQVDCAARVLRDTGSSLLAGHRREAVALLQVPRIHTSSLCGKHW